VIQLASEKYKAYNKEVSRKASMANKRLRRLEKNGLKDTPAYRAWKKAGGKNFSVRNKNYRALQKENARLNNFLQSKTSTVRGSNRVLKSIAKNTGIKYKNMKDLHKKSKTFFETASKVEQYLLSGVSVAMGYQRVFQSVSNFMARGSRSSNVEDDIPEIAKNIQNDYENTMNNFPDTWSELS